MRRSIAAAVPAPLLVATIQWGSVGPLLLTVAASAYGVRRSLGYLIGLIVLWLADHITTAPPPAARTATAWLIAGACLASMLRDPARARIINTALAAALVGATTLAALR
jgi:hypothetical protein